MKKILFLVLSPVIFCFLIISAYAQESVTITTYYPSPVGSYRDLETQRLAVGFAPGTAAYTNNFINIRTATGAGNETLQIGGAAGQHMRIIVNSTIPNRMIQFRHSSVPSGFSNIYANVLMLADIVRQHTYDFDPDGCIMMSYGGGSGATQCPSGTTLYTGAGAPAASQYGGIFWCCL